MARKITYTKEEWAFFLDENGEKKYCEKCLGCSRECKQSFRATVVCCPKYLPKGGKPNEGKPR